MTREEFNDFCCDMKASTNVVQWGGASVWKIGGKIYAVCSSWGDGKHQKISFKCNDMAYSMLPQQAGIIPAPYLARAKWVQIEEPGAMGDEDIKAYIKMAYIIIGWKLTKAKRKELALELPELK